VLRGEGVRELKPHVNSRKEEAMSEQDNAVRTSQDTSQDRPTEVGQPVSDCQSPPPAAQPPRDLDAIDPRARLLQLAAELARYRNRRLLAEFLRLRRAV
jgi:hypothetical protein